MKSIQIEGKLLSDAILSMHKDNPVYVSSMFHNRDRCTLFFDYGRFQKGKDKLTKGTLIKVEGNILYLIKKGNNIEQKLFVDTLEFLNTESNEKK